MYRGGSRISGKGVHMYKGVGVRFADWIYFSLNIPWKWNNLVSLRPNYFIFIGYLKNWGQGGVKANLPNPLWIPHWCNAFHFSSCDKCRITDRGWCHLLITIANRLDPGQVHPRIIFVLIQQTIKSMQNLKVVWILANSADPEEMQHYAAFHLGLHCLPKHLFRGFQYTKG